MIIFNKKFLIFNLLIKLKYSFFFKIVKYWKKIIVICLIAINTIQAFYLYNDKQYLGFLINKRINDYKTKKFAIVRRLYCYKCGFFSFYINHLGCINKYLSEGYIPIVDLQSWGNVYNKNKTLNYNPWELFFYQPYNFTLEGVKKYAKNLTYLECPMILYRPSELGIYYDKNSIIFWHNFAYKYMPIRNELINEAKKIMKNLFHDSKNILGVKIRGTDFLSLKPKGHSIPPKVEQVISDVKAMDNQYKYDFIFFTTEDELIKKKFIPAFGIKLKLYNPSIILNYNYTDKYYINLNEKIIGNLDYIKNYVLNIIILSKCLDLVASRGCGAAGAFILTNGFRNTKIYNLGVYR